MVVESKLPKRAIRIYIESPFIWRRHKHALCRCLYNIAANYARTRQISTNKNIAVAGFGKESWDRCNVRRIRARHV